MAGPLTDTTKDVYTINELDDLNRALQSVNEWLLDNDADNAKPVAILVVLADAQGSRFGSITKFTKDEDVKFEPGFIPAEVLG